MPETPDFDRDLKLNRRENILTELIAKRKELQNLLAAEKGHEFATTDSIQELNELLEQIKRLEAELKDLNDE